MRVAQVGILAILLVAVASAQDFLPLQTGNTWTYRSADGRETREIRVGTSVLVNGFVSYNVTGLTHTPILVARDKDGALLAIDPQSGSTQPLLRTAGSFTTDRNGCHQTGTVNPQRTGYQGPLGYFENTLQINYNVSNCKDAGLEEELYLENIGLARRTFLTVGGPRTLDLVSARVGKFTFSSDPSAVSRLAFDKTNLIRGSHDEPLKLKAQIQVALFQTPAAKVRFETEQRYEFLLKDAKGEVVYRWSDGHFFPAATSEEEIHGNRAFPLQIDLPANLPDGSYQAEAWLTTADGPQFASAANLEVKTVIMKTAIQKLSAEALPMGI